MARTRTGCCRSLGKHRAGAGCLYVNRLADVDRDVLAELVSTGYRHTMAELHKP